mmetsp:Transcript_1057/g.2287  ORF Transcript_1057/g.2287 Transcript_1057/m.2287 type:complete len:446 (-) Transcript_1057:558-1895(-)|eukprot:CAMPEP_0206433582 /NCGR_PEP_ID=MMETSP0324_2-20121206/8617_1 /ASSEMBLY_ACC=CAM_ASM_000836 /TAXON_ID=2866 /ORGANISM="Crypthecodinium cohnii, Strain Seligo" /LENGTH=445 /DNA_ID=CAMNT_0053899871 /DNA_START=179 /DNA_END=1516 /DNA_ORIENTATION=+
MPVTVTDIRVDPHWIEPYLESPWVKLMSAIAPPFPSPEQAQDVKAWNHFEKGIFIVTIALAGLGLLASIIVLLRSCCNCVRRPQARPSTKPLICLSILTFLLSAAGVIIFFTVGKTGARNTVSLFKDVTNDVVNAQAEGLSLEKLGTSMSTLLSDTIPKCPQAIQPTLKSQIQSPIDEYRTKLAAYNDAIVNLPGDMQNATSAAQDITEAGGLLAAPLVLVFLCVMAIVFIVCATRGGRGRGHCSHCCIRMLGPLLFAPCILVVTLITAADFLGGVAIGSFCKDVDTNVMTYVKHYADAEVYQVVVYYINETGTNPYLEDLNQASTFLGQSRDMLNTYESALKQACQSPEAFDTLLADSNQALASVSKVEKMLSGDHIYSYYKRAVHEDVCVTFISGIGWLFAFQFVVGLLCLPCLTFMADTFFARWTYWHGSGGQSFLAQELRV